MPHTKLQRTKVHRGGPNTEKRPPAMATADRPKLSDEERIRVDWKVYRKLTLAVREMEQTYPEFGRAKGSNAPRIKPRGGFPAYNQSKCLKGLLDMIVDIGKHDWGLESDIRDSLSLIKDLDITEKELESVPRLMPLMELSHKYTMAALRRYFASKQVETEELPNRDRGVKATRATTHSK